MNKIAEDPEISCIILRRCRQIIAVVPVLETAAEPVDEDRGRGEGGALGVAVEVRPVGPFRLGRVVGQRRRPHIPRPSAMVPTAHWCPAASRHLEANSDGWGKRVYER